MDLMQPDLDVLRNLVPFSSLSEERLVELSNLLTVERAARGVTLFREGEVDNQSIYLLQGNVRLSCQREDDAPLTVRANTLSSRYPLDDHQPHHTTAVVADDAVILRVDNTVLDYMLTWEQIAGLDLGMGAEPAGEPAPPEDNHWMGRLLDTLAFRKVPAANMRQLVERMERVEVKAGEQLVRQGEEGDYYYLIDAGRARVTQEVVLAELEAGQAFGEEALISGTARNATVTMSEDGVVMRLSKSDFDELLKEPVLERCDIETARQKVNEGAVWLDVRSVREFHYYRMPNAINLPLNELRQRMNELDPKRHYICYCKTGQRSSAAAFLLGQAGYDVSVLQGGLQVLPAVLRDKLGVDVA